MGLHPGFAVRPLALSRAQPQSNAIQTAAPGSWRHRKPTMSSHPTDFQGSVIDALRTAIEESISNAQVEVMGGGGHFQIDVVSPAFAGKTLLDRQRLVYGAIAHLMKGEYAPVHAVDSLKTRTPADTAP